MRAEFEASAQVKHSVSKGTIRENNLRNFLADGRLPTKYGLGAGEVVGRVRDTSRQCDLIVYDKPNGVVLLYDQNVQVFPIDCVYGIIEVKSALSKKEFFDALEKIKVLKAMAPGGAVSQSMGGLTMLHSRPHPFGIVFAYSLEGNSLDSLIENLKEWEKETPAAMWPNYVCILETGVIFHYGKLFKTCLDSDQITAESWPVALHHREDSLFQFYCALHDMCAHMNLGPVELTHYYSPFERIGKYVVKDGVEFQRAKHGAPKRKVRLTEAAIEKVVTWFSVHGGMPYRDVLKKQFGSLPQGMENMANLDSEVYLYNPDNLPGLHEIGQNPIVMRGNAATLAAPTIANAHSLDIDGRHYVIAMDNFTDADFEEC
ncbi:MAG: DUF6602 domain-containing protein [Candidatus Binataceae bacterium]